MDNVQMSAAEYVAQGLALVPIPNGKKGPSAKGWNKSDNVINKPQYAERLTGSMGLAHAYCQPAPTMALDIDDMTRAVPWLSARGVDVAALLHADDAVQIVSGRPGRAKLIYKLPPGFAPLESLTIKEKVTAGGKEKQITVLEFRCATGGGLTVQDVLPPSIHPDTGQPYRWGGKGEWCAIPQIPAVLFALWQKELAARGKPANRVGHITFSKGVDDTPRKRARVTEMLRHVSADCSYDRYRDIVWAILSLGWHDSVVLAEQWCQTAPNRFEDNDFWNVVNSFDPNRTPTFGTIHHHAKAGGWNG